MGTHNKTEGCVCTNTRAQSLRCEGAESPSCSELLACSCPPRGTEEKATSPPFPGCGRRDFGCREMKGRGTHRDCRNRKGPSQDTTTAVGPGMGPPGPRVSQHPKRNSKCIHIYGAEEEEDGEELLATRHDPGASCRDRTFSPTRRRQRHAREIAVFRCDQD